MPIKASKARLVRAGLGIVVALCFLGAECLVTKKDHDARSQYRERHAENCKALMAPDQKIACEQEVESREDYLPWWNVLIAFPEGVTAWAILLTLGAIVWQAVETRRSAEAARLAAEGTLRQAHLAEASMKQWVELEEWHSRLLTSERLQISFQVSNPTSYLLTALSGRLAFTDPAMTVNFIYRPAPLAPSNPLRFKINVPLTNVKALAYHQSTIGFSVSGDVTFKSAPDQRVVQRFEGILSCNPRETKFEAAVLLGSGPQALS